MTTRGRTLYDKWRRIEADATHWNWLDAETREFWERLAAVAA